MDVGLSENGATERARRTFTLSGGRCFPAQGPSRRAQCGLPATETRPCPAAGGGGSVRFPPHRPRSRRGRHDLCLAHSQTWVWKLRGRATACVPSPHSTQEQINTRTNHPSSASASCAQPHPHPEENKTKEGTLCGEWDPTLQLETTRYRQQRGWKQSAWVSSMKEE